MAIVNSTVENAIKKDKVIAIIPAYNEEGKIGNVVQKIKNAGNWVDTICVVDDCSTDNTYNEAKSAGATVIRHNQNKGVGAAIRTGMLYGWNHQFIIGVVLYGDDQHNSEELEVVFHPIIKEGYGFVQGSRFLRNKQFIPVLLAQG